jgi:cytochrome b subunit of formate dehydrogenase
VVVLSPDASPEDAVEAMRAGALDYRRFPDGRQELREMVRGHSKLHEQRLDAIEEATGFERWTWSMRVQHIVLIMTFSTLAVTGLPLIFPSVFEGIFFFSDSSLLRGLTHRAAGVGMIALSVLHVGQAIFSPGARRELFALLPRVPGDLRETWGNVMFNLGLREERPRAGKYDFVEKFEYFGVVWGTLVMVLTGLILWFADEVLAIVPLWVIDTARVVHRYEAILAILSVAVWHMYTVHLRPGAFPMSKVWIDGRISRHDMLEHHPAEYERLTGRQARRG